MQGYIRVSYALSSGTAASDVCQGDLGNADFRILKICLLVEITKIESSIFVKFGLELQKQNVYSSQSVRFK